MRVHFLVAVAALVFGLAGGYGLALLMREDAPTVAEIRPDPAPEVRQRPAVAAKTDHMPSTAAADSPRGSAGEPIPEPADVERVEVSGRVVDPAGEPVPGLRFRWTPVSPSSGPLPQRADFAAEAEWRAALRARLHRDVDLRVDGITEIVSGADGRFRVPDSVSPNGTLELLDPEWMTLSATVSLPIRPENIVRVARAAELEVSVDVEGGQPARKGRVQMRYKNSKLGYWSPPAGALPAVLRVPAGEAAVELLNLDISREAPPATVVLEPGKRTRLAMVLSQQVVLAVRVDIPPGSWLSFGLARIRDGLTDEEIINAADGGGGRRTDDGIEFAVEEPGEYVFFCRAGKATLHMRRVQLQRGRTDISLTLTPPADFRRLLLRITTDGKPLEENIQPQFHGLRGLVWERRGGEFAWLVPPDNQSSVVSVSLDKFGELAMPVGPASSIVDFAFAAPVQPRVVVRGARAEVRGNASILLAADSSEAAGYQTHTQFLHGKGEPLELKFTPMQPGRYRAKLHWNAGIETMGRVIELGVIDVAANSTHTLDLPAAHILTVALPPKSVRGWFEVLDASGARVVSKTQDGDSKLMTIRFLPSGTYTLRWKDNAGLDHTCKVDLNADTVVRPLGD